MLGQVVTVEVGCAVPSTIPSRAFTGRRIPTPVAPLEIYGRFSRVHAVPPISRCRPVLTCPPRRYNTTMITAPLARDRSARPRRRVHSRSRAGGPDRPERARATVTGPSAQGLKTCLIRPDAGNCLDALFRDFLLTHTTIDALALVERLGQVDAELRLVCHPVVHAMENVSRPRGGRACPGGPFPVSGGR